MRVSSLKVQGSKFKVKGFKVQCSNFNVQSLMFKVQSSMFNVQGIGKLAACGEIAEPGLYQMHSLAIS